MKHSFQLHHELPQKREDVLSWLKDFAAFARFHPLMEKVETITPLHFITHEFIKLPLGIKIRFAYDVYVRTQGASPEVIFRGKPQGIGMEFFFTLTPAEGGRGTRVEERVELSGWKLILVSAFTENAIRRSHTQLFATYASAVSAST